MTRAEVDKLLMAARDLVEPPEGVRGDIEVQKIRYIGAIAYAMIALVEIYWEHGEP